MAVRPNSMTPAEFAEHRGAAQAETQRRARVEANPTDTMLEVLERLDVLERAVSAPKPATKKKGARR